MINFEKYRDEILKGCAEKKLYPSYSEGITIEEFANAVRDVFYKHSEKEYEDFEHLLEWLFAEHKEPILTRQERAYLSAVIKPFRDKVNSITKITERWNSENICIYVNNDGKGKCDDVVFLPQFETGTMYKGMEKNKEYTIEELVL